MPTHSTDSKIALVTGAGSGIGEGAAKCIARAGYIVYLADINPDALERVKSEISSENGVAHTVQCDVTDEAQVKKLIDQCRQDYGRLDAAFNNAGLEGGLAMTDEFVPSEFDACLNVNLKGVFLCMKYEIQLMKESGKGSIVNMSSVMGLGSSPGLAAYSASKHGVIGLTKTAALENAASGIRVNAVCPGGVATPMVKHVMETTPEVLEKVLASVPMNRLGTTEEVGEAALWLMSDKSSFVTGTTLTIDGGYCAV